MGKYDPLGKYLEKNCSKRCTLSTREIEKILGFELPPSSRKYRQWWINIDSHVQAKDGWLNVGWKVESVTKDFKSITFSERSNSKK